MALNGPRSLGQVKRVLNVGGNSRRIGLPRLYHGWTHELLDIDPKGNPDIVCDARELAKLPAATYDAVYCSHNLEHYHRHDVPKVLAGFLHVLKPAGPIAVRDVIYGYGAEIERSGNDFFAHKIGFTRKSLESVLRKAAFRWVYTAAGKLEVIAFAFRNKPDPHAASLLKLPAAKN